MLVTVACGTELTCVDVLNRAVTESQRYERLCLSRNSLQILGGNGGLFHTSALQSGGKNTSIRKLHLRRLWQTGRAFTSDFVGRLGARCAPLVLGRREQGLIQLRGRLPVPAG